VCRSVARGVLGQASLSAYGVKPVGGKSGLGAGANSSATERAHKRNGGRLAAECRLPSLVTKIGIDNFDNFDSFKT
jgi:hypothetical protein